jgi:hypothetical protein
MFLYIQLSHSSLIFIFQSMTEQADKSADISEETEVNETKQLVEVSYLAAR